jgi:hypothetical protein
LSRLGLLPPPKAEAGRSRIIPGPISELRSGCLLPPLRIGFDVVDEGRVVVGRVGVDEGFLESIDDDPVGRRLDLDGRVRHPVLVRVEGDVDVSELSHGDGGIAREALLGGRGALDADTDSTEEVTSRSGDSEEEKDERGDEGSVDSVLDGLEGRGGGGGVWSVQVREKMDVREGEGER